MMMVMNRMRTMIIRMMMTTMGGRYYIVAVDKDGVISFPWVAHRVPQVWHIHVVIPRGREYHYFHSIKGWVIFTFYQFQW